MSDESNRKLHVSKVEKLTNIGVVNGNVFIVNNEALRMSFQKQERTSSSSNKYEVYDVTSKIKVIIKSNRFGRKIQVSVPESMTVRTFVETSVDLFELPWSGSIDKLMISMDFTYALVYQDVKQPFNKTLAEVGIVDGSEVELFITAIWKDKFDNTKKDAGLAMYDMAYCKFDKISDHLKSKFDILEARGTITSSKIRDWANEFFSHIDEI